MLCILALILAAPVRACIGFAPLHLAFPIDKTDSLDIVVNATATDLRGSSFVLEYDPTIVKPVAVQLGALVAGASCPHFFTWLNAPSPGDSIAVDMATLGCSVAGPGVLLRVHFLGLQEGTSPFRCRAALLRNSANEPLACTCPEGTIQVLKAIAVQAQSWTMVKSLFR